MGVKIQIVDFKRYLFSMRWCYAQKNIKESLAMERDELADDRMAFMAGEVGCVVFELVYNGIEINKDNIVGFLEGKRKAVGNVIHKGLLRDAAEMVRKGK